MRSVSPRPWRLAFTAVAVLAVSGSPACGGTGGLAPGPAPSGATSPATSPRADSGTVFPVTQSRLLYLTRLTGAQLCGLLHRGEAAQIGGGSASPGTFGVAAGLTISCAWVISSRSTELSISISKVESWQETRATDLAVSHAASLSIDGHPAIDFGSHLDVAAAGPGDPAISFASNTLAESIRVAQIVMPRLLAIRGRP